MPLPSGFSLAPAPVLPATVSSPNLMPDATGALSAGQHGVVIPAPAVDAWVPQPLTSGTVLTPAFPVAAPTPSVEPTTASVPAFNARIAADELASASWRKVGTDMDKVKQILEAVHQNNAEAAFNQAVSRLAKREGKPYTTAQEALRGELQGNPVKGFFNQAPMQEVEDLLSQGKNTYRPSGLQYRLRGMWNAVEDFFNVWNQHKVAGTLTMAVVAMAGRKLPFLGGLAGGAILVCSSLMMGFHELKAKTTPGMDQEKARHYEKSGENLTAFLMTMLGWDGIKRELQSGLKVAKETTPALEGMSAPGKFFNRLWQAVKIRSGPEHKPEGWRFVVGLFDDVLMPFNHVAEKSKEAALIEDEASVGMNPVLA